MRVTVEAPAKLNLTLDVVGRRADGYHELESIMQSVDITDTVTAEPDSTVGAVSLTVSGNAIPCDPEKNTAVRAARLFLQTTGVGTGVRLTVHKRIPQQAGMGGGSADAAAVLVALDALYGTHLPTEELCAMGARIGADVPFCVLGGTAYVTGIGEKLIPTAPLPPCYFTVAQPAEGVSTAAAYAALDAAIPSERPDHAVALEALRAGDLPRLAGQMINVFEAATALPGVAALRQRMSAFSPLACRMTGSGSAVFAVFTDEERAIACADAVRPIDPGAFVCRPCGGCRIVGE